MHPEQLSHLSISGHILRSKSEVIIDTALFSNRIPFRYECALSLGFKTFFPDFTIRHPKTKDFFYWEHFGMMDSPAYSQNAFNKLQLYNAHGIIPTINLITTYETKDQPLNSQYVQHLIEHYFLQYIEIALGRCNYLLFGQQLSLFYFLAHISGQISQHIFSFCPIFYPYFFW